MIENLDLFRDDPGPGVAAAWRALFERWLAHHAELGRLERDSTRAVYEHMWGGFEKWCVGQSPAVTPQTLDVADLDRFVQSRRVVGDGDEPTARYAWRALSLIDRVLAHEAREGRGPHNDAAARLIASREALRTANVSERGLPEHLDPAEARQLVVYLSSLRPRAGSTLPLARWQDLRNCTAVALQLGAGLTPGDVRALTVDGVVTAGGRQRHLPWKLQVPADGNRPARETPVAPWAGYLLREWLAVRATLPATGVADEGWLFPGTRRMKVWGKVAQYASVQDVLHAAGVSSAEGGSFRLRHTFALRQLRRGTPAHEVARWMGIANADELRRYERVLFRAPDVV